MKIENSTNHGLNSAQRQEYKASDLLKLAGLTYRQLNDWEERAGIMSSERATSAGWRKFTGEEVLALAVCAIMKRQFSISLHQVRDLYQWLIGKKHGSTQDFTVALAEGHIKSMKSDGNTRMLLELRGDQLKAALKDAQKKEVLQDYLFARIRLESKRPIRQASLLAKIGFPVYLIGLDNPMLLTESQLIEAISNRLIQEPTILCLLNKVFNEVRMKLNQPPHEIDKYSQSFLSCWDELRERADLTDRELEVIRLIRKRAYHRVIVHVSDREIFRLEQEEDLPAEERESIEKAVLNAIGSRGYQTVVLSEDGGRLHRLTRRTGIKLK